MKVKVTNPCKWEHPGQFPTFEKGTPIVIAEEEDTDFLGWHACEIAAHKTFVPKIFVFEGKLTRDYNPTELIQNVGDILEIKEIINAWLFATNDKGISGWFPAECVASVGF